MTRMTEHSPELKPEDKAEDSAKKDITKTADFRRFKKLLKEVVKAPPLRKEKQES